jgi:hypothetical protein
MYPNGTAVTLDLEFRPISIKSGESVEPSTMALVIGNPLTVQVLTLKMIPVTPKCFPIPSECMNQSYMLCVPFFFGLRMTARRK